MAIVKSFSVGDGDMFAIRHNSDNFTIIDCYLDINNKERIIEQLRILKENKNIFRFISTHPDEDHILGLELIDEEFRILNFYCVENQADKKDKIDSFIKYCDLRDNKKKAFYIHKDCQRKWMNKGDDKRGSSGIKILWPVKENKYYKEELQKAKKGESPNNISPIITYSVGDFKFIWFGDLETEFMEKIENNIKLPQVDFVFAPHHGRNSGKLPSRWLKQLNPRLIIIGEASHEDLNYYQGYNTITQNSAGDITFEIKEDLVEIYVSNPNYSCKFDGRVFKTQFRQNNFSEYFLFSIKN